MARPVPRTRLTMDCLEGIWESLEGDRKCRFSGTVRFVMTSLACPEIPARVIEACIEWEQPTPTPFMRVAPVPTVEILSEPESEYEPIAEGEPVIAADKGDPAAEFSEETTSESSSGAAEVHEQIRDGQQPWLMTSGSESSHQFQLEWMADRHAGWLATRTAPVPSFCDSCSVVGSSERSVTQDQSGSGSEDDYSYTSASESRV